MRGSGLRSIQINFKNCSLLQRVYLVENHLVWQVNPSFTVSQLKYLYLVCVEGQSLRFTTSYAKKKVSGKTGHSVTFEWNFSGGVDTVTWGLADEFGKNIDKEFVSLDGFGVDVLPPGSVTEAYRGRVNGTRTGDSSSGQASFTLHDVTKDDESFYGCLLRPSDPNLRQIPDFVQLVVVGMYLFIEL